MIYEVFLCFVKNDLKYPTYKESIIYTHNINQEVIKINFFYTSKKNILVYQKKKNVKKIKQAFICSFSDGHKEAMNFIKSLENRINM